MALRGRDEIRRVGLVGGGVIGTGWSIRCLAHGLDVRVTDPAPGAEERLRESVARIWPTVEGAGLVEGASPERLTFAATIEEAVAGVDFVQENVPEREEIKIEVFREIGLPSSRCIKELFPERGIPMKTQCMVVWSKDPFSFMARSQAARCFSGVKLQNIHRFPSIEYCHHIVT